VQYTIPAKDPYFKLLDSWTPKNYDDKYLNTEVTLKDALKASKNTISTWLMIQLKNPRSVREMAERMGISKSKIPNQPSIALGAADLSVMDMTSAYSTFANDGVHIRPIFVDKITDRNGKVIYSDVPESERALPSDYNYVMVDMLKHVVTNQQHLLETTFGGKTGTTNDHVDGWFMGITPELAVGTWVGGDQTFIKFRTIGDGAGSKMARPFYLDFMKRIESDKRIRFNTLAEFNRPADLGIELDCNVYAQFREEARKEQEEMDKQLDDGFDEELEDEIDLELDEEFDEEFEEG
jgi:penicillin-binding protein 1A